MTDPRVTQIVHGKGGVSSLFSPFILPSRWSVRGRGEPLPTPEDKRSRTSTFQPLGAPALLCEACVTERGLAAGGVGGSPCGVKP